MTDNTNVVKWTVSSHVRATYTPDGAVLLDINRGLCYSLDVVAARLWVTIEMSPEGISIEGIMRAVETQFKVARKDLETDAAEWLHKLQQMGLVHANGSGIAAKDVQGRS